MNNNRGNNRRRGRGNNRPQGGGQQLNRIDSRARGNAPQLLEKYRKLAHDAHLNGDRVQAEYYLQFADHYFRVIADARPRQDEQRMRSHDRFQDQGDDGEESGEFSAENEFGGFDQQGSRPQREERPREERPREERPREERARDDRPREEREPRERAQPPRRRRDEPLAGDAPFGEAESRAYPVAEQPEQPEPVAEARSPYEPVANPFVRERENRGSRGLRPRRERRDVAETDGVSEAPVPAIFDASLLPPSLGPRDEPAEPDVAEAAPAPKKRGRKPKAAVAASDIDNAA